MFHKRRLLQILTAVLVTGSLFALFAFNQGSWKALLHPPPPNPIALVIQPGSTLPSLITADGRLLTADTDSRWRAIGSQPKINDVLFASTGHVWAAADTGLYLLEEDTWRQINTTPAHTLESTHGYLFSVGPEAVMRLTESAAVRTDTLRSLTLPATPAHDLVMLGSHTHVLHAGDQVFQTLDVGLSWMPLNAPEPVRYIWTDAGGDLIAVTDSQVLRWRGNIWESFLPLPEGQPITKLRVFDSRVYALAGGRLYEQAASEWQQNNLPDDQNAVFTALEAEYPDKLWLLDSANNHLYASTDGQKWTVTAVYLE